MQVVVRPPVDEKPCGADVGEQREATPLAKSSQARAAEDEEGDAPPEGPAFDDRKCSEERKQPWRGLRGCRRVRPDGEGRQEGGRSHDEGDCRGGVLIGHINYLLSSPPRRPNARLAAPQGCRYPGESHPWAAPTPPQS